MKTDKIIREHLEEQFSSRSRFLWYEDKQMLKQGKYIEFASKQLQKIKNMLWIQLPMVLILCWYAISNLIEYGADPNWFSLMFGLSCLCVILVFVVMVCREYYTIRSSMSFLIKLLEEPSYNPETEEVALQNR